MCFSINISVSLLENVAFYFAFFITKVLIFFYHNFSKLLASYSLKNL